MYAIIYAGRYCVPHGKYIGSGVFLAVALSMDERYFWDSEEEAKKQAKQWRFAEGDYIIKKKP